MFRLLSIVIILSILSMIIKSVVSNNVQYSNLMPENKRKISEEELKSYEINSTFDDIIWEL